MKKELIRKYIGESFLIVFSILLALLLGNIVNNYKLNQSKKVALESITKEIKQNVEILKNWKIKHIKIRDQISDVVEGRNDSLYEEIKNQRFLRLELLTGGDNLINSMLSNTAWETAKATGIIAEFDYDITQQLTSTYTLQDAITQGTINKIVDFYFDMRSHDMQNIDAILLQFHLRFFELVGQEELMTELYAITLESLSNNEN